jgi:hypothetical protein
MAARSKPDSDTVPSIAKKPRENEQITKAEQGARIMKRKEQQQKVKQFEKAMKEVCTAWILDTRYMCDTGVEGDKERGESTGETETDGPGPGQLSRREF